MLQTFVIGTGLGKRTAGFVREISSDLVRILPVEAAGEPRWQNRAAFAGAEIGIGAAGCLLAHEKVWKTIAAEKLTASELFLVLEDDAVLTGFGQKWFARVLEKVTRARLDLVHLGRTKTSNLEIFGDGPKRGAPRFLGSVPLWLPPAFVRGFTWRTHAYLVSSNMADYLLEKEFDFGKPIDQHLKELFPIFSRVGPYAVATCNEPLFLQADRESLVEEMGR